MLLKRHVLEGIVSGTVTLAFRRWRRPTVRPGGRLRTAVGVLGIGVVERINPRDITDSDANRAGFESRPALLASLQGMREGDVYRISFEYVGEDPRATLRRQSSMSDEELLEIRARLARLDGHDAGPWTRTVLELIRKHPDTRAADLARRLGRDLLPFKRDVRKLKELGLTESREVGYRLSPRGRVVLKKLSPSTPADSRHHRTALPRKSRSRPASHPRARRSHR